MKKNFFASLLSSFFIALIFFSAEKSFAQTTFTDVKGTVMSNENKPLEFATAVLLQQKDSVMQGFALTDKNGNYKLSNVPKGEYILQLTFVGYETTSKNISVSGEMKEMIVEAVTMKPSAHDLNLTTIEGDKIPVQMKGDTIEYNAGAFKTQPNDNVEQLLKKLPGVQVDKDGNITAQGEAVKKITVDGKDFFTDDPKMATKNLPADAIDKVQVFDKKSETADFTGVDDGETEKSINLKLKPDHKNGTFGNATVGGGKQDAAGTDARYYGKLTYNRFTSKNKFSVIGLANNTNEQGFTFQEISSFSGGMQNMWDNNFGGNNADNGIGLGGSGKGIADNLAGGLNLNSSLKNLELNLNYVYSYTDNLLNQHSEKNYTGVETGFNSISNSLQRWFNHNQRANIKAIYKFSENSNLTLKSNLSYTTADKNVFSSQENNINFNRLSFSWSDTKTNSDNLNLRNNLTFKQKFTKKGRTFVADANYNRVISNSSTALNNFQQTIVHDSIPYIRLDSILQNQISDNNKNYMNAQLTYTEPVTEQSVIEISGMHRQNLQATTKNFFDINPVSDAEIKNDTLSSIYSNQYSFDRGGLKFRYYKGNTNFAFGAVLQNSVLTGTSQLSFTPIHKSYLKTLPSVQLVQKFNRAGRLSMMYNTRVSEPSIEQLQPVIDNTNPLSIYKGNPELDAEYSHNMNLNYNYYSQYSSTTLMIYSWSSYATNRIINSVTYDSLLVQTTMPVNSKYQFSSNGYLSFSTPIKFLGIKIELEPEGGYSEGSIYINGNETATKSYTQAMDASIQNKKKDDWDWTIGAAFESNKTIYATSAFAPQQSFSYNYYAELEIDLTKSLTLESDADYTIYDNESFAAAQKILLWDASLSFQFLKNDRGEMKLSARDLLNQDNGFIRTVNLNYTEERTTNTLGRYYLLTFAYNLSKSSAGSNSDVKVIMK